VKKIAVLSGKGGTGKSSIAASLAVLLSERHSVICADCDVDASNLGLVLGLREGDYSKWKPVSTNEKAVLNPEKCNSCGKCREACYFNAIGWSPENKPVFDAFLCEGCGACKIACPEKAIKLKKINNARIGVGKTKYGFRIVTGQLEMGESGSGKVVAEVKKTAEKKGKRAEIMVVDSAAGIGCPVIASVAGSDYVVAVTEPTPSALSDLKRALMIVAHFGIPYGIVINKHDLNPEFTLRIGEFAEAHGAEVLSKIPYDRGFVEALVNLTPVVEFKPETRPYFEKIINKLILNKSGG